MIPNDTISPATNMMLRVKSSAVKPDWRCCATVPKGLQVARGRSAHIRNMTVNMGMKEVSRKHGGRDSTPKIDFCHLPVSIYMYLSKTAFLKAHPYAKDSTLICTAYSLDMQKSSVLIIIPLTHTCT